MENNAATVYVAINKNGYMTMHAEMPSRNDGTGKWESRRPYINSRLYSELKPLIENAGMTWESEPELFTIASEK